MLHLFRRFNSEKLQRGDELNFDEAAQLQEKLLLGRVAFREEVVMVVKEIERLGELKRVLGDEGELLPAFLASLESHDSYNLPGQYRMALFCRYSD